MAGKVLGVEEPRYGETREEADEMEMELLFLNQMWFTHGMETCSGPWRDD